MTGKNSYCKCNSNNTLSLADYEKQETECVLM